MKKNNKQKKSLTLEEIQAEIDRIKQRMNDAELRGDTEYFSTKNGYGDSQATIDACKLAILECYKKGNGKLTGRMSN